MPTSRNLSICAFYHFRVLLLPTSLNSDLFIFKQIKNVVELLPDNAAVSVCLQKQAAMSNKPKLVLLFCGKRKSGKDFLTDWLQDFLTSDGRSSTIVKLSGPIKSCYAENHGLNFDELMGDGKYKEKYRSDMVTWSEEIR